MTSEHEVEARHTRTAGAPSPSSDAVEDRIAAAVRGIDALEARPLAEHAAAYEALHDDLQAVLADIDGA